MYSISGVDDDGNLIDFQESLGVRRGERKRRSRRMIPKHVFCSICYYLYLITIYLPLSTTYPHKHLL